MNNYTVAVATVEHVAATADTSSKIRQGMVIVRVLDGIVKNKCKQSGKTRSVDFSKSRRESTEEESTTNALRDFGRIKNTDDELHQL